MDSANLILTEPASLPALLRSLDPAPTSRGNHVVNFDISSVRGDFSQSRCRVKQKKEQAAKDFESVLLGKLLDEMKNSIGDWGFEEDGASKQIEGIFWLYLARHLANNGGLGLWKDIYQTLTNPDQINPVRNSITRDIVQKGEVSNGADKTQHLSFHIPALVFPYRPKTIGAGLDKTV